METQELLINNIIFISIDSILIISSFITVIILFCYVGRSNKENILQCEKYFIFFLFFVLHLLRRVSIMIEDVDEKRIIPMLLYNSIFDVYIKTVFIYNCSISIFIYRNIKEPTHLLRSIIKKPLHLAYEIFVIVVIVISSMINWFLTKLKQKYDNIDTEFQIGYLVLYLIFIVITIVLILKTKNIIKKYSFVSKRKLFSVLNCNLLISILYSIFFLAEIFIVVPLVEKGKINYSYEMTTTLFQYPLLLVSLLDLSTTVFQIYTSDCYLYILSKTKIKHFFCLYKCLFPSYHDNTSDINAHHQSIPFNVNLTDGSYVSSNYELLEDFLQKNNYNINSYYIEILDYIINASLVGISKAYDNMEIEEDLINEKNKPSPISIEKQEAEFIRNKDKNDFADQQVLNSLIESSCVGCEELKLNIKSYYGKLIANIFKEKEIRPSQVKSSITSHFNEENGQSVSVLRKNILEEDIKSFRSLSLKSYDMKLSIEIYPSFIKEDKPTQNINVILFNYLNFLYVEKNTYLPLIFGIFKVRINSFDELLFIITQNSLNESTQRNYNANSYYQLQKFEFPMTNRITNQLRDNKENIFSDSSSMIMEDYDTFNTIFNNDIQFLNDCQINNFTFEIMYYEPKEIDDDISSDHFCTSKGYRVRKKNNTYMLHFQFGRVFDLDNFSRRFFKCMCNRSMTVMQFSEMMMRYFTKEELIE